MATLVTVIHVFVCLFLVLTVLLQPGKGGGMGGAFGGGGSTSSVFGGSGGSGFLRKATVFIAAIFMLTSMTLAWIASNTGEDWLKGYSASERERTERREQLREAVLEGAEGAEGTEGDELIIDEDQLGDDAPITVPGEDLSQEELQQLIEDAAREEGLDIEGLPEGGEGDGDAADGPGPGPGQGAPGGEAADDGAETAPADDGQHEPSTP